MPYGLAQLHAELQTLTFARVTAVRCGKTDLLSAPENPDTPVAHFYGFARDLRSGRSIWYKKMSHARAAGRPGLFVGPVALRGTVNTWAQLPKKGSIVVGRVAESTRGPIFEWWMHDAAPLLAFARIVEGGRVAGTRAYESLELCDPYPDGLWALAQLVVAGDVSLLVDQLRPHARRQRHPTHKDGHRLRRGLRLEGTPREFVWHAAELVRDPELLRRFLAYAAARKVAVPDDPSLTVEALEDVLLA